MAISSILNWREKTALAYFYKEGASVVPIGIGGTTIFNLRQRKMIEQVSPDGDGQPRYQLTVEGMNAATSDSG